MKKILCLIMIVFVVSGCSKNTKIECTKTNDATENNFTATIKATFKGDDIIDATGELLYSEESMADTMCNILKQAGDAAGNLECDGKTIIIHDYHKSVNNSETITKDDFLEYLKEQDYSCK